MQNVVLVVHLMLALCLIGIVLMQRSEGGGLSTSAWAWRPARRVSPSASPPPPQ